MNPDEPDSILTAMHMVMAATENYDQTYIIFTSYQQLFMVAIQMIWW